MKLQYDIIEHRFCRWCRQKDLLAPSKKIIANWENFWASGCSSDPVPESLKPSKITPFANTSTLSQNISKTPEQMLFLTVLYGSSIFILYYAFQRWHKILLLYVINQMNLVKMNERIASSPFNHIEQLEAVNIYVHVADVELN